MPTPKKSVKKTAKKPVAKAAVQKRAVSKKVVQKPIVTKEMHISVSGRHHRFLAGMVLLAGFAVYGLITTVVSTNDLINQVSTNVLSGESVFDQSLAVPEQENPFSDLPSTHPDAEAIVTLYYRGVISGYPDGTVRPDEKVNRAEFSKMLVEAGDIDFTVIEADSLADCFVDVGDLPGDWFAPSVCAAKYEGWVDGYEGGRFDPSKNITKAEGLKIMLIAFGFDVPADSQITVIPFSDLSPNDWYLGAAEVGKTYGLISSGGEFNAGWELTRGDVSRMIYNSMKAKGLL